jgi:tetratricopeptide (TPR) repeat protein
MRPGRRPLRAPRVPVVWLLLLFWGSLLAGVARAGPEQDFVKRGRDYYGLFQYEKAKEQFEKAIQLDSSCAEAHFHLGLCLRKLNQIDAALRSLERALELDPEDLDCQKAVASIYIQMAKDQKTAGNRDKTVQFLRKACHAYPQNSHNWVSLFELYQQEGKWSEITKCAALLKKANREALDVGEDKNLQTALVMVANAYKEQQDHARAREFLNLAGMIRHPNDTLLRLKQELAAHSKDVANSYLEEGRALYEKKQYKAALDALLKAQGADSSNQEVNDLLEKIRHEATLADFTQAADEAEKAGNFDAALEHLNRAQAFDPNNVQVQERIASITDFLEKRERAAARRKAEELAKRQAQADKKARLDVFLNAARDNEKKLAFDAALINYQQALALDKANPEILAAIQRTEKAAAEQKARMERFGERFNQAAELVKQDQHDQAYALLKELADDPLNPQARLLPLLIDTCLKLGKFDEAGELTRRLAEVQPESDAVTYYRGAVAFYQGDFAAAREPLYKVYERDRSFRPELSGMIWQLWFDKYKWGLILAGFFLSLQLGKWGYDLFQRLRKAHAEAAVERALASGQYEKLIPLLEQKLSDTGILENRKQLTIARAEAYLRPGRFQEAAQRANEVVQKDARNPQALRILGEAYFQLGETNPDAIEKIHNLFKLDESRRDLLAFLATHFRSIQADHKLAMEVLQKQIALSPDDQETVFYLADLFLKRQNFQAAHVRVFERATKFDPERPEYLHGLIQCLRQANRSEEANRLLEKGQEKWPGSDLFTRRSEAPSHGSRLAARRAPVSLGGAAPESDLPPLPDQAGLPPLPPDEAPLPPPPPLVDNPLASLPSLTDPEPTSQPAPPEPTEAFELPPLPPLTPPAPPAAGGVPCPSCGASNHPREYYCGTCGKPLR